MTKIKLIYRFLKTNYNKAKSFANYNTVKIFINNMQQYSIKAWAFIKKEWNEHWTYIETNKINPTEILVSILMQHLLTLLVISTSLR